MKVSCKILLLLAVLATIPLPESFAQEKTEPAEYDQIEMENDRIKLKAPHRGYFLTEEQIEKLSPEARAEVEKLLTEKTMMLSKLGELRYKINVKDDEAAAPIKLSRYMLGVVVVPHKDEETAGVVIKQVTEDSPAQKSGLKNGDTILKVNETEISNLESLMSAVDASEGNEVTLTILRTENADTIETVQVTPVERPRETHPDPAETALQLRKLGQWIADDQIIDNSKLNEINIIHDAINDLVRIHPAIVMGRNAQQLPDNLSITITCQGKQPARITVKRDEVTWELTEDELDKLPAEIRPHVQHMLAGLNASSVRQDPMAYRPTRIIVTDPSVKPFQNKAAPQPQRPDEQISQQLKQLQQQLEELQQSVEKLQQQN